VAQKRQADDRMVHGIVASSAAIVQAHLHKFSEACSEEKIAYQLYQALLGDDHDRTKISSASLLVSNWVLVVLMSQILYFSLP
jgi:hypothetical protein